MASRAAWRERCRRAVVGVAVVAAGLSCSRSTPARQTPADPVQSAGGEPVVYGYRVVRSFPHDPTAFTQGLVYANGCLYESTGLHGQSTVRQVELETGQIRRVEALDPRWFGEGIALFQDRLLQLTWQEGLVLLYDPTSLARRAILTYRREGWGLTHDGTRLIASDGTATLHLLDPFSLADVGQLQVRSPQGAVSRLNELEWVEGEIYANVWGTDLIARIAPEDGTVTGWVDLRGLLPAADRTGREDVLNGIAYDADGKRLFVTGKLWPKLFEIEIVPAATAGAGGR